MSRDGTISQVRRFNRVVTQRVGALNDRYVARGRTLGASRVLWEIGVEGCEVRALRARLDLDSGQTSRLLRALEAEGLIDVTASVADRRIRVARLTAAGRAERALLDTSSDELASSGISAHPHELREPAGAFMVAYRGGEPIACGAVKHHVGWPSEIKRMWVAETARGLGIGRRLLETLEAEAREHGASATRLETNRALTEAIALYRSAGDVEVPAFNDEPFAHHWLQKDLAKPERDAPRVT